MYMISTPDEKERALGDRNISYAGAVVEAIALEMRRDSSVFLIGQDVWYGFQGPTSRLLAEFGPDRVLPAPIAENAIVSAGIGAALIGMRPVCDIMCCDFMVPASDAMFNQAPKYRYLSGGLFKVPMVIRVGGAGPGGGLGAHHSQSLEALAMHFPGLKVVFPSNPADAKGLLQASVRDDNPVMFFEHKLLYGVRGNVPEGDYLVPLGKARVARVGHDATVVSYGLACRRADEAAIRLAEKGIAIEVIDLRTLLPLDKETLLASIQKTGRLVVVSEDCKTMGVGAEIAAIAAEEAFQYLKAPVFRLAAPDMLVPGRKELEAIAGIAPTVDDIVGAVMKLLDR